MFAPSRGRELKLVGGCVRSPAVSVRPLAGAGIEIGCPAVGPARPLVRPLTGAGIEMGGHPADRLGPAQVRPLTGAGIEIQVSRDLKLVARGSPPHGGGN